MANGTYGIKRPAIVTSDDVEIFYYYRPSRSTESSDFSSFKRLDSNILVPVSGVTNDEESIKLLPGMYDLKLPLDTFGKTGIYTIYIKPKEIYTKIVDVSTLAADAYSDVRGIVLDMSNVENSDEFNNGGLVGYRVEYFNDNGERSDTYRIITSNFRCEPVTRYLNNSSEKGVKYRYNDSSNLLFCTVTPSSAMSFKSSSLPFIGKTSQKVALINTKFNPVMMEIEMVAHDAETISTMLEGDQTRNLENAYITTFDENGGIYHQAQYGNITNSSTGLHHDFKFEKKENINFEEINRLEEIQNNI